MLKVTFTAEDGKLTLSLDGHAGQANNGHDIVCSACSILAYTVAQVVKFEAEKGHLKSDPTIDLGSGDAVISCEPKEENYADILKAFYVADVGYTLLAHNYPQFVDVKQFGES